jgi:hypothetical protein
MSPSTNSITMATQSLVQVNVKVFAMKKMLSSFLVLMHTSLFLQRFKNLLQSFHLVQLSSVQALLKWFSQYLDLDSTK